MTQATLTLAEFLLARIAEDEAHVEPKYHHFRNINGIIESQGEEAACWAMLPGDRICVLPVGHAGDIQRLRAECEAKRRIVELAPPEDRWEGGPDIGTEYCVVNPEWTIHQEILRLLALPYAQHAHYREAWRP